MNRLSDALTRGLETSGLPGAVGFVADRDGVRFAQAAGRRGVADDRAMSLDDVFLFASMTKAVTTVAALQLVEQGKLALDEPLGDLLPYLKAPRVLDGFDAAGAPRYRPAKRPVTLRALLTHTAGFGYEFISADLARTWGEGGPPPMGVRAGLEVPLLFDPGDRWEYGYNTDWAGLAVEAASGQDLASYFNDHILGPLGMTRTSFTPDPDRLVPLHIRIEGGVVAPMDHIGLGLAQGEYHAGGAGLFGTGGDYLRFLRMILGGGALEGVRILRPETVAAMATNQIGDLRAGEMTTTAPHLAVAFDPFPGMHKQWGLGFLINPERPAAGGRSAGSLSWAGICNTHYWIDPAAGVTGLWLSQLLPFGDPKVMDAFGAFERAAYDA
jgi:methyl acetate hydrolase